MTFSIPVGTLGPTLLVVVLVEAFSTRISFPGPGFFLSFPILHFQISEWFILSEC